ncbi:MAG: hypothetical protein HGA54_02960 [Actinobacteria bacterium]|nr:hypothetical protein [Actinomycetota bacterium]
MKTINRCALYGLVCALLATTSLLLPAVSTPQAFAAEVSTTSQATSTGQITSTEQTSEPLTTDATSTEAVSDSDVNKVQEKNHALEYVAGFCTFFLVLGAGFTLVSYRWEIT